MALEFPEAREFASTLVQLLNDTDVEGHVVDTLLKMKAAGHEAFVRPLLNSDKAWMRRTAKKYIERYPGSSLP